MQRKDTAKILLIVALAFVFGVFGVGKFTSPIVWIGWMPLWMDGLLGLPKETWLQLVGASEILFAILLLIPIRSVRQIATILIVLHLIGILTQIGWNDIAVRDIGLLMSSLALLFLL